jgi:phage-related protein
MIDSQIIYRGRCFTLSGITDKGICLVQEFIEGLDEANKKKVLALLKRSADNGPPKNTEKFKHLEDKICEFKSYQVRLLCFFEKDKVILLTHGFIKKKDKAPKEEIERAKSLMVSYQRREKAK